jgi:hypothetical protein
MTDKQKILIEKLIIDVWNKSKLDEGKSFDELSISDFNKLAKVIFDKTDCDIEGKSIENLVKSIKNNANTDITKNQTIQILSVYLLEISKIRFKRNIKTKKPENIYWQKFVQTQNEIDSKEEINLLDVNYLDCPLLVKKAFIDTHRNGIEIMNLYNLLISKPNFPKKMIINSQLFDNPVYNFIDKSEMKLLKKYLYPEGNSMRYRIMPLDVYLIKALDKYNQPMLLNYFSGTKLSGWKTWLFPHRGTDKDLEIEKRFENHKKDFATLTRIKSDDISIKYFDSGDYIVSFKPDFGYGGLVLYIFFLCSVYISDYHEDFIKREFEVNKGNFNRNFKWFYVEELLNDETIFTKNADIIRGIHTIFETSLSMVPLSIKDKII